MPRSDTGRSSDEPTGEGTRSHRSSLDLSRPDKTASGSGDTPSRHSGDSFGPYLPAPKTPEEYFDAIHKNAKYLTPREQHTLPGYERAIKVLQEEPKGEEKSMVQDLVQGFAKFAGLQLEQKSPLEKKSQAMVEALRAVLVNAESRKATIDTHLTQFDKQLASLMKWATKQFGEHDQSEDELGGRWQLQSKQASKSQKALRLYIDQYAEDFKGISSKRDTAMDELAKLRSIQFEKLKATDSSWHAYIHSAHAEIRKIDRQIIDEVRKLKRFSEQMKPDKASELLGRLAQAREYALTMRIAARTSLTEASTTISDIEQAFGADTDPIRKKCKEDIQKEIGHFGQALKHLDSLSRQYDPTPKTPEEYCAAIERNLMYLSPEEQESYREHLTSEDKNMEKVSKIGWLGIQHRQKLIGTELQELNDMPKQLNDWFQTIDTNDSKLQHFKKDWEQDYKLFSDYQQAFAEGNDPGSHQTNYQRSLEKDAQNYNDFQDVISKMRDQWSKLQQIQYGVLEITDHSRYQKLCEKDEEMEKHRQRIGDLLQALDKAIAIEAKRGPEEDESLQVQKQHAVWYLEGEVEPNLRRSLMLASITADKTQRDNYLETFESELKKIANLEVHIDEILQPYRRQLE